MDFYNYSYQKTSYKDFVTIMMKWLFIGLGITALTSVVVSFLIEPLFLLFFPILIISSIVEIILVIFLVKKLGKLSVEAAKKYFYAYCVINGITMSFLISTVAPGVAILAFALTCAFFGLLYSIAKNTDYDFQNVGRICLMALPILLIGYIILLFVHAPGLYYLIVTLDLVLFTGITLYDMKKVRLAYEQSSDEQMEGIAMICALELYLDFINIFIDILSLIADNS